MSIKSDILFICLQDEDDLQDEIKLKQNEFLDLYSLYRDTNLPWIKEELLNKAYQLHLLNPDFTFHV